MFTWLNRAGLGAECDSSGRAPVQGQTTSPRRTCGRDDTDNVLRHYDHTMRLFELEGHASDWLQLFVVWIGDGIMALPRSTSCETASE